MLPQTFSISIDIRFIQKLFLGISAALVTFTSYNVYKIEKSEQYLYKNVQIDNNFMGNEDLSELENILYSDQSHSDGSGNRNQIFEYSESAEKWV